MKSLSIVTTVYDRVDCLASCIHSVGNLNYTDWEHIIVADGPPPETYAALERVVDAVADPRITLHRLPTRRNDFGISPAAFGLQKASGKFLAFLDDDNAYLAEHFDGLLPWLESDQELGIVYSACLFRGDRLLNEPVPALGRIDLGQLVFRRELFRTLLGDQLCYSGYEWDWQLLSDLLARGVRYRFINQETFVFAVERFKPFEAEAKLVKARVTIGDVLGTLNRAEKERNFALEQLNTMRRENAASQADNAALRSERAALEAELLATRNEIAALRSSLSWRLTAPLRNILERALLPGRSH
jgi:glycosyltransferase involved in cell wall biosynthesis